MSKKEALPVEVHDHFRKAPTMGHSPHSRWVYIFGMQDETSLFAGLLGDTPFGDYASPGLYKIGTTIKPERRWQQVQVHSPWELRVFAIMPGGFKLEAKIHDWLKEYRTRGEWFAMPRSVMHDVLQKLEVYMSTGRHTFATLPWCDIVLEENLQ